MEKNIQDDRLDDYVRKSFEDYEEAPASDMWGRIEEELPPVVPESGTTAGKPPIRRYLWQMTAAASILLLISSLVCGRLYYENKIREISAIQGTEQSGGGDQKSAQAPYPAGSVAMQLEQKNTSTDHTDLSSNHAALQKPSGSPNLESNTSSLPKIGSAKPSVTHVTSAVAPTVSSSPRPSNISEKAVADAPPTDHLPAANPVTSTPGKPENQAMNAENNSVASAAIKVTDRIDTLAQINDFQLLANKNIPFVHYALTGLQTPVIPVRPLRAPSGWYLGLHLTPTLLVEKTETDRPTTIRPRVISSQEKTHFTADYWLKAGKHLQGRWGIETGIGYRAIERNTMHRARFRFINGRPGNTSGGQMRSYDFDYDLDTYGGSTEVTLRMEQVDSNTVVPEDEPLQFQVKTSERLQLLRIPALATARFGQGQLTGVFKAGLIGNVVLRNEMDIVTRVSENTRFRPGQGSNAYTLRPDKNHKFFLGYQVSAGLEYRPMKHFSWVLEPTLSGDFARKNSAGKQLPSIVTIGLNAGMNYYF